jgi:acetylornithine deacetylase/succinyl-diaminopimelate desuccinylase-like protein
MSQLILPISSETPTCLLRRSKSEAESRLLSIPSAPPVVYGQITVPGAQHTIVFYAHYDGQPVTPSEWEGGSPFTPVIREVDGEPRIYARSAGDDKAAIFAQLTALDALRAAKIPFRANIRFVWEGEEEAGSPHLEQILDANRDLVHGDVWLVCDGPVDQSGKQTVVFGARGDALEVTVYGPHNGLHSGHYANWAPNPAMMMAQLLAGMKDEEGHVLVPHFCDGIAPLTKTENEVLGRAPVNDQMLMGSFWLGHVDGSGKHLLELINQLSLNPLSESRSSDHTELGRPATGCLWHERQSA